MAYNLAKYKFQPGQRVEIITPYGEPRGGSIEITLDGELVAGWDFSKGNTGVIEIVTNNGRKGNTPPWIYVRPDEHCGFGVHTFTVKEIRHVKEKDSEKTVS